MMSEKEILMKFLEKYQETQCLWDKSHADYHNKVKKNEGYRQLLEIYRIIDKEASLNCVKRKIATMRNSFRKEYNKMLDSARSGAEEVYQPTLWYFHMLLFTKDEEAPRMCSTRTVDEILGDSSSRVLGDSSSGVPGDSSCGALGDYSSVVMEDSFSGDEQPSAKNRVVEEKSGRLLKRKMEADDLLWKFEQMAPRTNQYIAFGQYVTSKLESMDPEQGAIAQKLISDVLFYGEMKLLTGSATVKPAVEKLEK